MAEHNELGKLGEKEASAYLTQSGYTILERDWQYKKCDIDIIALNEKQDTVVFIEVKCRSNNDRMQPEQAVDAKKIRNIGICANAYIKMNNIPHSIRFDIIGIVQPSGQQPKIEHIVDAFNPLLVPCTRRRRR